MQHLYLCTMRASAVLSASVKQDRQARDPLPILYRKVKKRLAVF